MERCRVTRATVRASSLGRATRSQRGDAAGAEAAIVRTEYPFVRSMNTGRAYTELESMRLFLGDCFIDRYSGTRLVFPGNAPASLARHSPDVFPAHKNWKMSETHIAFWELFPTVDHVVPVARGGARRRFELGDDLDAAQRREIQLDARRSSAGRCSRATRAERGTGSWASAMTI